MLIVYILYLSFHYKDYHASQSIILDRYFAKRLYQDNSHKFLLHTQIYIIILTNSSFYTFLLKS